MCLLCGASGGMVRGVCVGGGFQSLQFELLLKNITGTKFLVFVQDIIINS